MILVVRRTYRREAVVGPYWIYQINAFSAKVSLCPKRFCSDVFVCVSYLAGRESWRLQLLLLPGSVLSEEGIQEDARCGQHHRIGDWVTPGHFTMAVLCCGNHRPPWAAGFTLDGWPDQRKNGQDRKLTYNDTTSSGSKREEESKLFTFTVSCDIFSHIVLLVVST